MQKYTLILVIILSLHAISLWQTKTIPAVASLDREATRLGVSRQSLVKMWIAEKIESKAA